MKLAEKTYNITTESAQKEIHFERVHLFANKRQAVELLSIAFGMQNTPESKDWFGLTKK